MKRLRVILLFLLLGAVVNVGVAWGLALTVETTSGPEVTVGRNRPSATQRGYKVEFGWIIRAWEKPGTTLYRSFRSTLLANQIPDRGVDPEDYLPSWVELVTPNFESKESQANKVDDQIVIAYGWPAKSLWSRHKVDAMTLKTESWSGIRTPWSEKTYQGDMYPFPMPSTLPRLLPIRPIWSGFALNLLLFGLVPWMLFPGRIALRGYLRHRRGRCHKCGYDLQGTDHQRCPECGETIRRADPA